MVRESREARWLALNPLNSLEAQIPAVKQPVAGLAFSYLDRTPSEDVLNIDRFQKMLQPSQTKDKATIGHASRPRTSRASAAETVTGTLAPAQLHVRPFSSILFFFPPIQTIKEAVTVRGPWQRQRRPCR